MAVVWGHPRGRANASRWAGSNSRSANSFSDQHRAGRAAFALVLDSAGLEGGETVLDLYSGTGAISLQLAKRCRWVYGVEMTQAAVDDAARNAAANGIANCTFLAGEVRFVLPSLIAQGVSAQVVVADPPRGSIQALRVLSQMGPARIVYVR